MAAEAGTEESAADKRALEEAFVPETEEALRRRRAQLEKPSAEARAAWMSKAAVGDFDSVRAPMDVYAFAGEGVKTDPRRCDAYRDLVAQGVGLSAPEKWTHLSKPDFAALESWVRRKAGAFWVKDTPRTTVRGHTA